MQLVRLDLANFRAFREASISFALNGLTLIAGPNNTGKSAILSGIDLLRTTSNPGGDEWLHSTEDEFIVTGAFQLANEDRFALLRELGANRPDIWLESSVFRFVEWTFRYVRGRDGLIGTRLAAANPGGQLQPIVTKESAQTRVFAMANLAKALSLGVPEGEFPGLDHFDAGRDYADAFERYNSYSPFAKLLQSWAHSTYHFGSVRAGSARQLGLGSTEQLSPDGGNLGHVLVNLKTNDDEGWAQLTEIMEELVPEVGRLQMITGSDALRVGFKESATSWHNHKDMGTGVEQLLMTALVGVRHPRGGLMMVEEPETNLHPEAQRGLLARLQAWSKDLQIIVTTHSTVFLDRASEATSQIWLVKRSNGCSTVQRADNDLIDVFQSLGVRPADVLSAEGVLLVEGDTDASVLEIWFGARLRRHRIAVVAARGSDRAWNAEDLVTWVDKVTTLKVPAVFLRDRDELPAEAIKKLEAGPVHVLQRRELENYLLNPQAVGRLLRGYLAEAGEDVSAWSDECVADELRAAADRVKPVVILKRFAARLVPIRQLDRQDVRELIEQGVSRQAALDRVRQNVASVVDLEQIWNDEERAVEAVWEQAWGDLAAGSDVLEELWVRFGRRYDKKRDTVQLAHLVEPPTEFRSVVDGLLEKVDQAFH